MMSRILPKGSVNKGDVWFKNMQKHYRKRHMERRTKYTEDWSCGICYCIAEYNIPKGILRVLENI
jgi:hypothetical protein